MSCARGAAIGMPDALALISPPDVLRAPHSVATPLVGLPIRHAFVAILKPQWPGAFGLGVPSEKGEALCDRNVIR